MYASRSPVSPVSFRALLTSAKNGKQLFRVVYSKHVVSHNPIGRVIVGSHPRYIELQTIARNTSPHQRTVSLSLLWLTNVCMAPSTESTTEFVSSDWSTMLHLSCRNFEQLLWIRPMSLASETAIQTPLLSEKQEMSGTIVLSLLICIVHYTMPPDHACMCVCVP